MQRLHDALEAENRNAWVDWEGFPLTADWWAEIQAGIEVADTFVFVISPGSAASKVCGQELEYADTHNKRIVPIVYRDVSPEGLSASLSHLNWIFCRESDDFNTAFRTLMDIMDTDLDWVKAHTRLTQRAVEWDKKSRNDSFVLRGDDLAEAEQLLAQTDKEPKLTELQMQYIIASRQSAIRRQRITLGAVTVGLVVTVILGIVAFLNFQTAQQKSNDLATAMIEVAAQRDRAEDAQQTAVANQQLAVASQETVVAERATAQAAGTAAVEQQATAEAERDRADMERDRAEAKRIEAERQARLALASQLASQAQIVKDGTGSLPLILAKEAVWTTWLTDTEVITQRFVTEEADVALRQASNMAERFAWRMTLPQDRHRRHTGGVNSAVFSPDGTIIVSAGDDETVRVWDAQTDEALFVLIGHTNRVNSVVFSPDGATIAGAGDDKTIWLWDVQQGQQLQALAGHEGQVNSVAFSPDGATIVSAGDQTMQLWDVETGRQLRTLKGHEAKLNSAAFSPDGDTIVSAGDDQTLQVWDVQVEEEQSGIDAPKVGSAAFSPDGTILAGVEDNQTVRLWDTRTGQELRVLEGRPAEIPSGTERDIHDTLPGEGGKGQTVGIHSVAFSPDGSVIVSVGVDRTAQVWDVETGRQLREFEGHTFAVYSPDGTTIAGGSGPKIELRVADIEDLLELADSLIQRELHVFTGSERERFGLD